MTQKSYCKRFHKQAAETKEGSQRTRYNWTEPKIELLKQLVSGLIQVGDKAAEDEVRQSSGVNQKTTERAVAP